MATINNINHFSNFILPCQKKPNSNKNDSSFSQSNFDYALTIPNISINFSRTASPNNFSLQKLDYTFVMPNATTDSIGNIFRAVSASSIPNHQSDISKEEMGAEQALLGPLVLSGADLISDFSSHVRRIFSSANLHFGTENPAALTALGFTAGFSVFSGGLNLKDGIKELKTAQKISDVTGKTLGWLKMAKGGAQTGSGIVAIPMRALVIAALATASKVYASIAGVLGGIGNIFSYALIVFAGVSLIIKLYEQHQFQKTFQGILKDPTLSENERNTHAFEYLKQLTMVTPQEKGELRQWLTSNEKYRTLNAEQIATKYAKKEHKLLLKKEAQLKRLFDENCLNLIRQKGPEEAQSVIEAIKKKRTEKIILSSISVMLISIVKTKEATLMHI